MEASIINVKCWLCGQKWPDEGKHECPMKGKLDTEEELIAFAIQMAEMCDHYCCGLSPVVCKAKAITQCLRRHDLLKVRSEVTTS